MSELRVMTDDELTLRAVVLGDGPATILSAGACFLEHDLTPLAQKHRLILYDQRNRGGSDAVRRRNQLGVTFELADIDAVRRHFQLDRVTLFGWSYMGAMMALYAARHPEHVARLVIVGATPVVNRPEYQMDPEKARQRIDSEGIEHIERLAAQGLPRADPERYCREYARVFRVRLLANPRNISLMKSDPCVWPNERPDNVETTFSSIFASLGDWDWRDTVKHVSAPTLVIQGREDLIPPAAAAAWAETIPGAQLLLLPDAGHFPWFETPEAFYAGLEAFLHEG